MADITTSGEGKRDLIQKPEKPDQEAYEKNLQKANDEHATARERLNIVKQKLEFTKAPGKSPRQQELYEELNGLRAAQQAKKDGRTQIEEQIKKLDASIKAKLKEQGAARGKMPYKTIEELEDAIKQLNARVESGKMMIADERRAVDEISSLNKVKKNFASFSELQKTIDAEKAKYDELKQQKKDPEVQELNDRYEAVKKELDDLKAEQDAAFNNLNSLRDERTKLQEEQQEKWQEIQRVKDEYFAAKSAYRDYEQEAWRIKKEKRAKQEREAKIAYKRKIAQEKMEQASEKAYTSEILICEGLIGFFDPSSAEAARKAKLESGTRALAAQPTRSVDASALKGKKLSKKEDREDDYFVGIKKAKKGRKDNSSPASGSPTAGAPSTGKFNLNVRILEELSKVNVETPAGKDDVPKTLEKLREKLAWYKENQQIKTEESIAKAQEEIDRLEAEFTKENGEASGSSTPTKKTELEVREGSF